MTDKKKWNFSSRMRGARGEAITTEPPAFLNASTEPSTITNEMGGSEIKPKQTYVDSPNEVRLVGKHQHDDEPPQYQVVDRGAPPIANPSQIHKPVGRTPYDKIEKTSQFDAKYGSCNPEYTIPELRVSARRVSYNKLDRSQSSSYENVPIPTVQQRAYANVDAPVVNPRKVSIADLLANSKLDVKSNTKTLDNNNKNAPSTANNNDNNHNHNEKQRPGIKKTPIPFTTIDVATQKMDNSRQSPSSKPVTAPSKRRYVNVHDPIAQPRMQLSEANNRVSDVKTTPTTTTTTTTPPTTTPPPPQPPITTITTTTTTTPTPTTTTTAKPKPARRYVNVNDIAQAAADKRAKALLNVGITSVGDQGYVNVDLQPQADDNDCNNDDTEHDDEKKKKNVHDYELASAKVVDADYSTLGDQHVLYQHVVRMEDGVYDGM